METDRILSRSRSSTARAPRWATPSRRARRLQIETISVYIYIYIYIYIHTYVHTFIHIVTYDKYFCNILDYAIPRRGGRGARHHDVVAGHGPLEPAGEDELEVEPEPHRVVRGHQRHSEMGQMGSALMGSLQISCFSTEGLFGYSL